MKTIKPSSQNIVVSLTPRQAAAIFEAIDCWGTIWNDALLDDRKERVAVEKRLESVYAKIRKATKW